MATSGPGATNLITAVSAAFYDSVPVLFLVGQVATFRRGSNFGVKAYGFQETPIIEMVRPIIKWTGEPLDASDVIPYLDIALVRMNQGRKGPALVSIPDDLQRTDI